MTMAQELADLGILRLSDKEARILDLFDELQELQYQLALAKVQKVYRPPDSMPTGTQQLRSAQDQILKAKATHALRSKLIGNVMMANPVLQAIYHGNHASPIERELLPFVEQRDALSSEISSQTSELKGVVDLLTQAEVESSLTGRQNAELAAEIGRLVDESNQFRNIHEDNNARHSEDLTTATAELEVNKRMRMMAKETASAVVVGSGIDWTKHEHLRSVVLDPY